MRAVVLSLWAVMAAGAASAQTPAPIQMPVDCQIDARSVEGGRLEVFTTRYDGDAAVAEQITWHPPVSQASGAPLDLSYSYEMSSPTGDMGRDISAPLGKPRDAYVEMPLGAASPDHLRARVSGDGVTPRIFAGAMGDEITGTVDIGLAEKGFDAPIADGLADWRQVRIDMLDADKTVGSATFDVTAVKGRDALMAYARHLVSVSDPRVCRRKSL